MFSNPQTVIRELRLDPGMKVADFGTGSGHYSFAAAQAVSGAGKVYAIDVQKDLLSKLKNEAIKYHLLNIDTVWGDIDNPNGSTLRSDSCDAVILANVLFQVESKESALKEAWRVLKPRGKLLLVEWSDSFGGLGPAPSYILQELDAKTLVENNGFKVERSIQAGSHHYGFIARKQ